MAAGQAALRLVTVQLEGQPELPACAFALASGLAPGTALGAGPPENDTLRTEAGDEK